MTLRTFSSGGGVQSIAALILSAHKTIDFPIHLFSNVGDDSEHPETLAYVKDVAMPYAKAHSIEFIELRHIRRDGEEETLYKKLTRPGSRSTGIPIFLEGSGAPGRRSCTSQFKIARIAVWQRRHGATKTSPAITGLGISLDEMQRMRTDSGIPTQVLEYPLVDLRLTRAACEKIIRDEGLPVPPKSSCYFCPYHNLTQWHRLKVDHPDLFEKAVALEQTLSNRSDSVLGRGKVFLNRKMQTIDRVVGNQIDLLFPEDEDNCESGFCMT